MVCQTLCHHVIEESSREGYLQFSESVTKLMSNCTCYFIFWVVYKIFIGLVKVYPYFAWGFCPPTTSSFRDCIIVALSDMYLDRMFGKGSVIYFLNYLINSLANTI